MDVQGITRKSFLQQNPARASYSWNRSTLRADTPHRIRMVSTAVLVFALGGFGNCLGIRDIAGYLDRSGHNAVCQSPRQNIRHVVFVARVRHPNDESKLVRDRIRFPSTPAL